MWYLLLLLVSPSIGKIAENVSDRFAEFGNWFNNLLGLKPRAPDLATVPATVYPPVYPLNTLTIPLLTTAQIQQITTAQIAALNTEEIQYFTTDAIPAFLTTQLAALNTADFAALTTDQIVALTTYQVPTLAASGVAAFTTDQIQSIETQDISTLTQSQVAALSTDQIVALTTDQFPALSTAAIQALGTAQISAIETQDIELLSTNQVQALTTREVNALTTDQIVALTTAQISAISTSAIRALTTSQVRAIETQDIAMLTSAQAIAMTTQELSAFTTSQVVAFSAQYSVLSTAQQAALPPLIFLLTTNQIASLSTAQVAALSTDDIASLTTAQVQALTTAAITVLSTDQIQAFETQDLAVLTTSQISVISSQQTMVMSTTQVESFTSDQVPAFTTNAYQYLTTGTPLILDLDGNGVSTLSIDAGVRFDLFADGAQVRTGWVSATDGLLVLDRNRDGQINDGSELFGSSTVLANGQRASDGYVALSELDVNGDGVINSSDSDFGALRVWIDSNSNGVSDDSELRTLTSLGITQINLSALTGTATDNGNLIGLTSSYETTDGMSHDMADVWFLTDRTPTDTQVASASSTSLARPTGSVDMAIAALNPVPVAEGASAAPSIEESFESQRKLPSPAVVRLNDATPSEPQESKGLRLQVSNMAQTLSRFADDGINQTSSNVYPIDDTQAQINPQSAMVSVAGDLAAAMRKFDAQGLVQSGNLLGVDTQSAAKFRVGNTQSDGDMLASVNLK